MPDEQRSHSYEGVRRDLELLEPSCSSRACPRGDLVLLHDYPDPRNDDPGPRRSGVARDPESRLVQESPRAC